MGGSRCDFMITRTPAHTLLVAVLQLCLGGQSSLEMLLRVTATLATHTSDFTLNMGLI